MKDIPNGHINLISQAISEMNAIFYEMGFTLAEGPEIEDEWHNFDALNVPKDHPARDMQDTFWLKGKEGKLLRTHTSPVQVRYMESHKPPLRIVVPGGKVYRNEATDMKHEAQFYQTEALIVERGITFAHLKATLEHVLERLFKGVVSVRFRPGYFPFVEPGVEVDVQLSGPHVPGNLRNQWIEIMGAGMVHPNVLRATGINPKEWQGYALAIGVDRVVMLKYEIDDIRLFYSGDLRFVNQF